MPRRTSTQDKRKKGTTRSERQATPKIVVLEQYPAPVCALSDEAVNYYNLICKHLEEHGALLDADAFTITYAAQSASLANEYWVKMVQMGCIQEFQNGARQVSPEWAVYRNAVQDFIKHSKNLGLDPRSRQDMQYFLENGESDSDDPMDEILG